MHLFKTMDGDTLRRYCFLPHRRLGAAQHRSLTLIGYFSSLLQPMTGSSVRFSLAAVTPYIVPWSSVAVHVCNKALSPNHILYALNGTVVGLAAVDSSKVRTPSQWSLDFVSVVSMITCPNFFVP